MTRHANSLPTRLQAFYAANPGEELTFADICAKFCVTICAARGAVRSLQAAGELEVVHVVRARGEKNLA